MSVHETTTVELYVRSLAPRGGVERQERVFETLSNLASDCDLSYEVTVWGDAVRTDGPAAVTRPGAEALATVEQFRDWAAAEGVDLVGLDRREAGPVGDPAREVLSLPAMALAEYRDTHLVSVTPHEREGEVHTVRDHLDDLRERHAPETTEISPPAPSV